MKDTCFHGIGPDGDCEMCRDIITAIRPSDRSSSPSPDASLLEARSLVARLAAAESRAERAEETVAKYKTALDAINVVRKGVRAMSALFADCVRCREPHGMLLYGELTRHCNRCAHEVVEARGESIRALTANLATAIAERDEARRMLAEMWSAAWLLMWRAIGDSISADDWCNEWAGCPSPEAFAEATRERDALRAGKWAGAWRWDDTGEWCSRHRPNEDVHTVELAMRGTGFMWRFRFEAGEQAGSLDAAKAAADAHLVAAGWYLEGGPHGAGEAK